MDLQIAKYKYDKQIQADPREFDGNPIFKRMAVVENAKRTREFSKLVKRLRNSAYRRHEGHNKQLAFMLNREKFQQNATWQTEYDRLASQAVPETLQPFVNARLEELKSALLVK